MEIGDVRWVSADRLPADVLVSAINQAYRDYALPVRLLASHVDLMVRWWDLHLPACWVACAGRDPVAVGLLGVRGRHGWVSGVGVVPGWRGRGLGRSVMERLLQTARELHLSRLSLEVLLANEPAITLYQSLGFRIARELLSWERAPEEGSLPVPRQRAQRVDAGDLLRARDQWQRGEPCWQTDEPTLWAMVSLLQGWLVEDDGRPMACALTVHEPGHLAIQDIGIAPGLDPRLAARALLQNLQLLHMDDRITCINVGAEDRLNRAFAALGFRVMARHYEMVMDL